jgi:hypothetical protein
MSTPLNLWLKKMFVLELKSVAISKQLKSTAHDLLYFYMYLKSINERKTPNNTIALSRQSIEAIDPH